jgi:DNA replication and repair protein RecF
MWIKTLRYYNFRNINETQINLLPGLNILVGDNAQGKTNFIEGIYLCLSGQSFRYGDNVSLSSFGQIQTSVSLTLETPENVDLKFTIENGRKYHWMNGKKVSSNKLSTLFPVVLFSPESLATIKEGSAERRELIDDFLIACPDINYQTDFDDYLRVLKSKNRVLKSFSDHQMGREQALALLASYEDRFIELATRVSFHRIQGIIHILEDFRKAAKDLYPIPVEIDVDYVISDKNALHYSRDFLSSQLRHRLSELKMAEMAVGHSLVGPQKHEIRFLINNKDSRTFCSQGQQRALILAFKLAQLMYHRRVYGTVPILFLDDVLSELDGRTRANLVKLLNVTEGQIFITTTDKYLCRDLTGETQRYIAVEKGEFSIL